MREIKFRVQETTPLKENKWIYVTLSELRVGRLADTYLQYENWCEYTGLVDKNGKEIYEGDIFKTANNYIGQVLWQSGGFDAVIIDKEWPRVESLSYAVEAEIEIIGNIYENPGLINEA